MIVDNNYEIERLSFVMQMFLEKRPFASTEDLAEEVLKYYQHKIPEGSIVLPKEEYEKLNIGIEEIQELSFVDGQLVLLKDKKVIKQYPPDAVEFVQEKTREKILQELHGEFSRYKCYEYASEYLYEYAKKYGVRLE